MHFEQRTSFFLELGVHPDSVTMLKSYLQLLWAANEELNLISRKMTYEELIDNHLIDCLLPLKHFPSGVKEVADFGSGGGLPGVVFAILFPQVRFHLFEKSPKKQEFLTRCRSIAPNLVIHGEILPKDLTGIELIMARAFKPIDVIIDLSRSYFSSGGKYFLLKARHEKIEEELNLAHKKFKGLKAALIPLKSPVIEVERHLVLIEKEM
jgi:16S rRNA (guanine527-N7)-methyltransferase